MERWKSLDSTSLEGLCPQRNSIFYESLQVLKFSLIRCVAHTIVDVVGQPTKCTWLSLDHTHFFGQQFNTFLAKIQLDKLIHRSMTPEYWREYGIWIDHLSLRIRVS